MDAHKYFSLTRCKEGKHIQDLRLQDVLGMVLKCHTYKNKKWRILAK